MTDDSRFRAPRAHSASQAQPAGARVRRTEDPLAELARLIGQEDPFADFVAHRPGGGQRRAPARAPDPRALERRRPAAPSRAADEADDAQESRVAYSYGGARAPRSGAFPSIPPVHSPRDDRAATRTEQGYAPDGEDDDDAPAAPRPAREARPARRSPAPADDYEDFPAEDYDPEYDDDAYLPAHGDEFYEEAPRRRLKGWLLVGAAVLAVIAVGTSGLFAYRALFGPESAGTPAARIISPEAGPTKMVPGGAAQSADGKPIQDRIGGEPPQSAERIVPREESPLDQGRIPQADTADRIPQPGGAGADRIPQAGSADRIPAGTVTAAPPPFSQPPIATEPGPAQAGPLAAPANLSTEPRRVRTVTVRADGTVVSDPARPAGNMARTAPATSDPLALQGGQGNALPPPRPAVTTSSAPLRGDNPWSGLAANPAPAPAPAPTVQAALPPSPPPVQSPPPIVAVQTPPPAGSYVVQVAAQKSEGEARATWQALQQRYSNVLGAQQATIRRVDLGERGVFYRAQVGPFTTRAQASEVCQSLKAAGGECVIQRN